MGQGRSRERGSSTRVTSVTQNLTPTNNRWPSSTSMLLYRHLIRAKELTKEAEQNYEALEQELNSLLRSLKEEASQLAPAHRNITILTLQEETGLDLQRDDTVTRWLSSLLSSPAEVRRAPDSLSDDDFRGLSVVSVKFLNGGMGSKRFLEMSSPVLWVLPEPIARMVSRAMFSPLDSDSQAILNGAHAQAVACLESWDNDVLALHEISGGHSMLMIGEALFETHSLRESLNLDQAAIRRFLLALEAACEPPHAYACAPRLRVSQHMHMGRHHAHEPVHMCHRYAHVPERPWSSSVHLLSLCYALHLNHPYLNLDGNLNLNFLPPVVLRW
jgi:hypothetical protein